MPRKAKGRALRRRYGRGQRKGGGPIQWGADVFSTKEQLENGVASYLASELDNNGLGEATQGDKTFTLQVAVTAD